MALALRHNRNHIEQRSDQPAAAAWQPLTELANLSRELESFLGRWTNPARALAAFTPLADLEETADAYLVEIELPGVQRSEIDIEVSDRRLTVRGERKEKERVGILRRRDRTIGTFAYEITLPSNIDEDQVSADLTDGVLTVRLPKPASERPRRIPIQ